MKNRKYDWVEFYTEFANKLLAYKENRQGLITVLMNIYEELNLKYPLIDGENISNDLCPFSVMGLFNKQISLDNRINILKKIKEKFNVESNVPTDFSGIPVLNNMKSMFFSFTPWRKAEDIPNLWNLFEIAIKYADNQTENNYNEFCKRYNAVIKQSLVKWNITMGLFWIRPYTYLNLDTKNRTYFQNCTDEYSNIRNIDSLKNVPIAEKYIKIINECKDIFNKEDSKYKNFVELSDNAFITSHKTSKATFLKWFKPILEALKVLGGSATPNEVREKIIAMEHLSDEEVNTIRGKTNVNKFENEVAFARNYMVYEGLIDGSERGIWKITDKGINIEMTEDEASRIFLKWVDELKNKRDKEIVEQEIYKNFGIDANKMYSKENFLNEAYIDEKEYNTLVNLIRRKKNVLLQGAPGVGKTFIAKRLAYSMMGEKDTSRIKCIQFHQSYSYEDFIEGYRPTEKSFKLENGVFYDFCKLAENNPENEYFFIIDEINRGNLSKIFGELLMLIENDKRGEKLNLAYSKIEFSVPKNLYIIGMMNTADRSLALIDYALRRRFSFYSMNPAFDNEQFKKYQMNLNNKKFDELINNIKQLNIEIEQDATLGKGFKIGHSYFCNIQEITDETIESIIKYEIIPLIEEYWFDDVDKFNVWYNKLNGVING